MPNVNSQLNGDSVCCSTFASSNLQKVEKLKMTSIIPRLNRTHQRSDGSYPVVIQVIRHRIKREIDTPYLVWEDEFNNLTNRIVCTRGHNRSAKMISDTNRRLAELCLELQQIADTLYLQKGEAYASADISRAYKGRDDQKRVFVYADALIGKLNNEGRAGTACNYRSASRAFETFLGNRDLMFEGFTCDVVDCFAEHLYARGNQTNTVTCYLKQLRALYNKALKEHIVTEDLQPFQNQLFKEASTRKRALPRKEVQRVEKADLKGCHKDVRLIRDLFLGSIYLRGMSFVDLCHLKKENIEGDSICYKRHKTNQALYVFIERPLKDLLARYADPASPYLFPMLRGGGEHKDYLNAKSRLGKRIRELGIRLGFEFSLTFHTARHTWATLAHNAGVEMSVISSCLGHTSEKTTRIYLAEMDPKKINQANRAVLNLLK